MKRNDSDDSPVAAKLQRFDLLRKRYIMFILLFFYEKGIFMIHGFKNGHAHSLPRTMHIESVKYSVLILKRHDDRRRRWIHLNA